MSVCEIETGFDTPVMADRIDDYASAMFRFERLHARWIDDCARYLTHLFGERLRDAVVLDYAFGRGNWSVAFRRAGARRVIAVDASASNVVRFGRECERLGVDGIDMVQGNFLEQATDIRVDLVWAHGILHHVPDADALVGRLANCLPPDRGLLHLYAYDSGSLRQWVVETARRAVPIMSETAFRAFSMMLSPRARLRARDDLTAPVIRWYSIDQLTSMARRQGLHVMRQDGDFQSFLGGESRCAEFSPHHLLCGREPAEALPDAPPARPPLADLMILRQLGDALLTHHEGHPERLARFAAGLFNTHFSVLDRRDASAAVVEDFLFLLYCQQSDGPPVKTLPVEARSMVESALASARGERPQAGADSIIARQLSAQVIRL